MKERTWLGILPVSYTHLDVYKRQGEDYLEAILVLQKQKGMVRSVDMARHMGVSKPSVCHAAVSYTHLSTCRGPSP